MARTGTLLGASILMLITGIYGALFIPQMIPKLQTNAANSALTSFVITFLVIGTIVIVVIAISAGVFEGEI